MMMSQAAIACETGWSANVQSASEATRTSPLRRRHVRITYACTTLGQIVPRQGLEPMRTTARQQAPAERWPPKLDSQVLKLPH